VRSCVRIFGYPKCYGALYVDSQCCCSDEELGLLRRGALKRRVDDLDARLEKILERIAKLECADL
jgi:hypothetical protein